MTIQFAHITGPHWVVLALVAGLVGLFVYFHVRGGNGYNFLDTLMDGSGKASLPKHLGWIGAVLVVWLIMVEGGKDATIAWPWAWEFLATSLGYRVATGVVSAYANKQPTPAAPPAQTIGNVVNVGDATEVPIPTAVARPAASAVRVPTNRVHE